MKTLTIVIPSYNTERFIDKNMKTFIDERLFNDVEILLIDDGSKDSTAENILKYANKYQGYIRAISKPNGGHGSVINRGIEEANGKYFKVIDADDWVETKNLVKFVEFLKKTDSDLIINPYYTINETSGKQNIQASSFRNINSCIEYKLREVIDNFNAFALHSITIKTDIFRSNNINVTEKCFYEDFQYDIYPIIYVKTISFFEIPVYCYLIGQQNQSVSAVNALKNIDMQLSVYKDTIKYFEDRRNDIPDNITNNFIDSNIVSFGKSIYNTFLRNYNTQNLFLKYQEYDHVLLQISEKFHTRIMQKHQYIRLALKHKLYFNLFGFLLSIYKKLM